ncbi:MAG TPA: paraquat-inducible protein A [Tepidisphaeraceae bacterium]|nr:paraquat-inducible protein A [Tepidisphaeraceae bacterium]
MSDPSANLAAATTCRRCGQVYVAKPRRFLQACPHCAASPTPLRSYFHDNRLAATLAVIALIVLIRAQTMPFISATDLGQTNVYSLIGGIHDLYQLGYYFIASILLIFSVLFPIAKLILILSATSSLVPLSSETRHSMHKFAVATGKYSLLDVLVVAISIVVIRFGALAQVSALPGTGLFCIAILLSILAGHAVKFETKDEP